MDPHLPHDEIFASVEHFYRKFFFRPRKIASIVGEMLGDWNSMKVRLGEAREKIDAREEHQLLLLSARSARARARIQPRGRAPPTRARDPPPERRGGRGR